MKKTPNLYWLNIHSAIRLILSVVLIACFCLFGKGFILSKLRFLIITLMVDLLVLIINIILYLISNRRIRIL